MQIGPKVLSLPSRIPLSLIERLNLSEKQVETLQLNALDLNHQIQVLNQSCEYFKQFASQAVYELRRMQELWVERENAWQEQRRVFAEAESTQAQIMRQKQYSFEAELEKTTIKCKQLMKDNATLLDDLYQKCNLLAEGDEGKKQFPAEEIQVLSLQNKIEELKKENKNAHETIFALEVQNLSLSNERQCLLKQCAELERNLNKLSDSHERHLEKSMRPEDVVNLMKEYRKKIKLLKKQNFDLRSDSYLKKFQMEQFACRQSDKIEEIIYEFSKECKQIQQQFSKISLKRVSQKKKLVTTDLQGNSSLQDGAKHPSFIKIQEDSNLNHSGIYGNSISKIIVNQSKSLKQILL